MQSLTVIGKRWFQKSYGNTYHSVQVLIDGIPVYNSGIHYGYGDQYLQTAKIWLDFNGYLPDLVKYDNGSSQALWSYCADKGINFAYTVSDVSREKDLR